MYNVENPVINAFLSTVKRDNFTEVPSKSLFYNENQPCFSATLNIESEFKDFFLENKNKFTIQPCIRTTPKILSIVGIEGLATPLTHMMSFFMFKQENLLYALKLVNDFFLTLGICNNNDIFVVTSKNYANLVTSCLPVEHYKIVILPSEKLRTTLGLAELSGEYIKFFCHNSYGLIPIGNLNVMKRGTTYGIDSSFLVEPLTTLVEQSSSLYDSSIFRRSIKTSKEEFSSLRAMEHYKIVNLTRAVSAMMLDRIYPGAKGISYVPRRLIREICKLITLNFLKDTHSTQVVNSTEFGQLPYQLTKLIQSAYIDLNNLNFHEHTEFTNAQINFQKECIEYFNFLKKQINAFQKREDLVYLSESEIRKVTEEVGLPLEILQFIAPNAYVSCKESENTSFPMYPMWEHKVEDTYTWILKLHGER